MNCHSDDTEETIDETNQQTKMMHERRHSFTMTLLHMVPMIILFSFYDSFVYSGNKGLFYVLVTAVVVGHAWIMIRMKKR